MIAVLESGIHVVKFNQGAFSTLFRDDASTRAYKLFFSYRADRNIIPDKARRAAFNSEVNAYEIAMRDHCLRQRVPLFHGIQRVARVIEQDGPQEVDRCDLFLQDCCYEMELIHASPQKWSLSLTQTDPELVAIQERFIERGIRYLDDTSLFWLPDRTFRVIDFGVRDAHGNPSCW